jgi:hypothetical protein
MTATSAPPDEVIDRVLHHTWDWFALHSGQRMSLMNHWLLGSAFTTAGYATSVGNGEGGLALAIGFAGALLTLAFSRLDRRTRQLVHLAEDALALLEERMADESGVVELRLVARSDVECGRFTSYGQVIGTVHGVALVLFLVAGALGPTLAG